MSSPMLMVEMLNGLYSQSDAVTSEYDVYKVDTTGHAYVVSSALICKGPKDAAENAGVSLDVMTIIQNYSIPHLLDGYL